MSDTSSNQTTSSQEERIEKLLKESRERRLKKQNETEENRKLLFETYYDKDIHEPNSLFNQPGIYFKRFDHKKIKFIFKPCEVADYVNKRITFSVSLRYMNNHWLIFRDTIPSNYKNIAYSKFYKGKSFRVDDDVVKGIMCIYFLLVEWAKEHSNFRLEKFQRYKSGDDVYLDSDDQEMFLTQNEIFELRAKREAILKRMVPPSPNEPKRRYNTRYFLR